MNANEIKQEVMKRLGISAEEYHALIYEMGELYFERRCGSWEKVKNAFRHSPKIWKWWANQWMIIDEFMIRTNQAMNLAEYRRNHTIIEWYPNERIVKEALDSYDKVVQEEIALTLTLSRREREEAEGKEVKA